MYSLDGWHYERLSRVAAGHGRHLSASDVTATVV